MSLKLNWPNKILLYSTALIGIAVLLTSYITVMTAAHLWEEEFLERNTAYAKYTSHDLLRIFGGRFDGSASEGLSDEIRNLTDFNGDLLGVMILTESGRVLFSTLSEVIVKKIESVRQDDLVLAVQEVIKGGNPISKKISLTSEHVMDVIAPVSDQGSMRPIAVRYIYSYESLEAKTANLIKRVLAGAVVLFAFGLALSAYLSRGLIRPVKVLSDGARQIAAGERDYRIELKTGDEMEALAMQFNQMVDSLRQHQEDLEEANRELSEANMDLMELQAQLLRSERLAVLGQLSAGVSHELDNPIGVIMGYAELLQDETHEETASAEFASVILDEAKRCKRIIAGLLDFSRPSSGERQVVDLCSIANELVAQLAEQRTFRRTRFTVDNGDVKHLHVDVDPDSVRQILVNLALNSVQAMGDAGVINIELKKESDRDMEGVLLRFSDKGSGIPSDLTEKIFEPFYTTKKRSEGTGLGLSICRKLAEEAEGWIRAVSHESGAVFEMWLPTAHRGEPSA
ncbi:MAG: HAMP domain-containing sensor histidine kinase [bacterium]